MICTRCERQTPTGDLTECRGTIDQGSFPPPLDSLTLPSHDVTLHLCAGCFQKAPQSVPVLLYVHHIRKRSKP